MDPLDGLGLRGYKALPLIGIGIGDMTDSLRVWWKLPELGDRSTILVIVGTRSAEHSLRSQVGIGSIRIACWDS